MPGTDAAERKVRARVRFQNWNVEATVEQDFALKRQLFLCEQGYAYDIRDAGGRDDSRRWS